MTVETIEPQQERIRTPGSAGVFPADLPRRPLRVLFVESGTELGGAQMALLTMLRFLDRTRVTPFYASLGFGRGNLPDQVERLGIRVFRLPPGRFRHPRQSAAKVRELSSIIERENVGLVFSNGGHPLLFARPAARWTGRACVWWVHGYFADDPLRGHFIGLAERILSADAMFANSRYTARTLRQVFPEHTTVRVVHYGIDLDRYRPDPNAGLGARHSLGVGSHEAVVGILGRLHPFKGQDIFLRAAHQLTRRGVECRYVLVGGTPFDLAPCYAQDLRRYARRAGLEGRVAFLGQREDTNDWLNACDVVVHASVEPEPWGLAVAEGMAAGRAVVATNGGGPAEMIDDGRTGRLVPLAEATPLADAIEALLESPDERRRIGEAARRHAEAHFEARRAAAVFCDELERVHAEKRQLR